MGIDPGLANTGYAVVERSGSRLRAVKTGCIRTSPKQALAARLLLIYNEIAGIIAEAAPDAFPRADYACGMFVFERPNPDEIEVS